LAKRERGRKEMELEDSVQNRHRERFAIETEVELLKEARAVAVQAEDLGKVNLLEQHIAELQERMESTKQQIEMGRLQVEMGSAPATPAPAKAGFSASKSFRKMLSKSPSRKEVEDRRKAVVKQYEKKWDGGHKHYYWVNNETKVSQLEDPIHTIKVSTTKQASKPEPYLAGMYV